MRRGKRIEDAMRRSHLYNLMAAHDDQAAENVAMRERGAGGEGRRRGGRAVGAAGAAAELPQRRIMRRDERMGGGGAVAAFQNRKSL